MSKRTRRNRKRHQNASSGSDDAKPTGLPPNPRNKYTVHAAVSGDPKQSNTGSPPPPTGSDRSSDPQEAKNDDPTDGPNPVPPDPNLGTNLPAETQPVPANPDQPPVDIPDLTNPHSNESTSDRDTSVTEQNVESSSSTSKGKSTVNTPRSGTGGPARGALTALTGLFTSPGGRMDAWRGRQQTIGAVTKATGSITGNTGRSPASKPTPLPKKVEPPRAVPSPAVTRSAAAKLAPTIVKIPPQTNVPATGNDTSTETPSTTTNDAITELATDQPEDDVYSVIKSQIVTVLGEKPTNREVEAAVKGLNSAYGAGRFAIMDKGDIFKLKEDYDAMAERIVELGEENDSLQEYAANVETISNQNKVAIEALKNDNSKLRGQVSNLLAGQTALRKTHETLKGDLSDRDRRLARGLAEYNKLYITHVETAAWLNTYIHQFTEIKPPYVYDPSEELPEIQGTVHPRDLERTPPSSPESTDSSGEAEDTDTSRLSALRERRDHDQSVSQEKISAATPQKSLVHFNDEPSMISVQGSDSPSPDQDLSYEERLRNLQAGKYTSASSGVARRDDPEGFQTPRNTSRGRAGAKTPPQPTSTRTSNYYSPLQSVSKPVAKKVSDVIAIESTEFDEQYVLLKSRLRDTKGELESHLKGQRETGVYIDTTNYGDFLRQQIGALQYEINQLLIDYKRPPEFHDYHANMTRVSDDGSPGILPSKGSLKERRVSMARRSTTACVPPSPEQEDQDLSRIKPWGPKETLEARRSREARIYDARYRAEGAVTELNKASGGDHYVLMSKDDVRIRGSRGRELRERNEELERRELNRATADQLLLLGKKQSERREANMKRELSRMSKRVQVLELTNAEQEQRIRVANDLIERLRGGESAPRQLQFGDQQASSRDNPPREDNEPTNRTQYRIHMMTSTPSTILGSVSGRRLRGPVLELCFDGYDLDLMQSIMVNILGAGRRNDRFGAALTQNGLDYFTRFIMASPYTMRTLPFHNSTTGTDEILNPGEIAVLLALQKFLIAYMEKDPSYSEVYNLTVDEYNQYMRDLTLPAVMQRSIDPSRRRTTIHGRRSSGVLSVITSASGATDKTMSAVDKWDKGVKRDKSAYSSFTNKNEWARYKVEFTTIAENQGCNRVLDINYFPATDDERDEYKRMKGFMYEVMLDKFEEPMARYYVDEHTDDKDAREVWTKMTNYFSSPVITSNVATELLTKIMRANVSNARQGYKTYLLAWIKNVNKYGKLVPIDNNLKLMWLTSVCSSLDAFDAIRTRNLVDNPHMPFEQYWGYIIHEAELIDQRNGRDTNSRTAKYTNIDGGEIDDEYDGPGSDDRDEYEAYESYRNKEKPRPRVDNDTWKGMSDDDKSHWTKMSSKSRFEILQYGKKLGDMEKNKSSITVKQADSHDTEAADDDVETDDDDTGRDETVEVNKASTQQANKTASHNADPRRIMSQAKQGTTSKPKRRVNMHNWITDDPLLFRRGVRRLKCNDFVPTHRVHSVPTNGHAPILDGCWSRLRAQMKRTYRTLHRGIRITRRKQNNSQRIQYVTIQVTKRKVKRNIALMDRGANGGIGGDDCCVIAYNEDHQIDVTGLAQHQLSNIPTGTIGAYMQSNKGPIIGIMHQYGISGRGHTIHSAVQFEAFENEVDDRSKRVGGKQRIVTADGYVIPLDIRDGLPYLEMRPFTKQEYELLPHVILTSDERWNPGSLDSIITDTNNWKNTISEDATDVPSEQFTRRGRYLKRVQDKDIPRAHEYDEDAFDAHVNTANITDPYAQDTHGSLDYTYGIKNRRDIRDRTEEEYAEIEGIQFTEDDEEVFNGPHYSVYTSKRSISDERYQELKKFFLFQDKRTIEKTLEATTQYYKSVLAGPSIKEKYKTPFPASNVQRRHEGVATDWIKFDTPARGSNGAKGMQFFCGRSSLFIDVYLTKSDAQFPNTLEDNIREHGAMDVLISDNARAQTSRRVREIQRAYRIKDRQSEPRQQHQNFAERRYRDFKARVKLIMDATGAHESEWFWVCKYVAYIMNRTAVESLEWRTPHEKLTGQTPDISMINQMPYRQRVAVKNYDAPYPSGPSEEIGYFIGFGENVGHSHTFKILIAKTGQVVYRSRVRVLDKTAVPNEAAEQEIEGDPKNTNPEYVTQTDIDDAIKVVDLELYNPGIDNTLPAVYRKGNRGDRGSKGWDSIDVDHLDMEELPTIDLSVLPGRSYLQPVNKNGERLIATIEKASKGKDDSLILKVRDPTLYDSDPCYEDIVHYGQVIDFLNDRYEYTPGHETRFRRILDHRCKKKPSKTSGGKYDFLVEFETGEVYWIEEKQALSEENQVLTSIYLSRQGMLGRFCDSVFRPLKKVARNIKVLMYHIHKAKSNALKYMYGVKIPQGHKMAMRFDEQGGHTKWRDAEIVEVEAIIRQKVFKDMGYGTPVPEGYSLIRVHMVYAVKHDLRYKARLVADGNLTSLPTDSVYSSVVSLRSVRIVSFIAEQNGLELWGTDIGNAYIESFTQEKVCIYAGEEFGDLAGHLLLIERALYGLRSSGKMWADRFSEVLYQMGFFPCLADNDVWMRDAGDHCEYIAVYVDDLLVASRNPQAILDTFMETYKFLLKGSGPLTFHLGCDYYRDCEGVLCQSPKKYIVRIAQSFSRMFGKEPRHYSSPLEKNDHPELDDSDLLDAEGIKQYQSLIGSLQWAVSLGRYDIAVHVMTLSRFRVAPRVGHLERAKRVIGYLCKMKDSAIRYRTERPDLSQFPETKYDWNGTPYQDYEEPIPDNAPEPKGGTVDTVTYFDANLYHDLRNGRAVSANIHFLNKTPIDAYSKMQNTVNTSTYGSEIDSGRIASEQILDLRMTLRYMGVPLGRSVMLGDSRAVLDNTTRPHSQLNKRHSALSYHRIRELVSNNVISFHHVPGELNPSDILSKHWGYAQVWHLMKTLLFWQGDTADLLDHDNPEDDDEEEDNDKSEDLGSDDRGVKISSLDSRGQDEDSDNGQSHESEQESMVSPSQDTSDISNARETPLLEVHNVQITAAPLSGRGAYTLVSCLGPVMALGWILRSCTGKKATKEKIRGEKREEPLLLPIARNSVG